MTIKWSFSYNFNVKLSLDPLKVFLKEFIFRKKKFCLKNQQTEKNPCKISQLSNSYEAIWSESTLISKHNLDLAG